VRAQGGANAGDHAVKAVGGRRAEVVGARGTTAAVVELALLQASGFSVQAGRR
jgi:hypothetical protein